MTLNQLQTLTDDELGMALHIVNEISPPGIPPGPFSERELTWFKHKLLVQKFIDAFPRLTPEGHEIYVSLMQKLGVKVEINVVQPPPAPAPEPTPVITGSVEPSSPEVFQTGSV